MKKPTDPQRFAVCIDNSQHPASLEAHKIYQILQDQRVEENDELRVIDESGEDYIYPSDLFVLVDLPEDVARSFSRTT